MNFFFLLFFLTRTLELYFYFIFLTLTYKVNFFSIPAPTPIQTDNTTVLGFVTKNLNPKATKSTDMRYWWMRDRSDQEQFRYYWSKGSGNRADCWTKHFCAAHHREKRPSILTPSDLVNKLRISRGLLPHQFRASARVC